MTSAYLIQPACAMRGHFELLPDTGGVYAMLLDNPAALAPALHRANLQLDALRMGRRDILYLGATEDSLRRRIKSHLSDDSYRSNFRMSLGALLAEELGLLARPRPGCRYFSFEPESEQRLSDWIGTNISIALRTSPHAMVEEKALIGLNDPVLNISQRRAQPSASAVLLLRRRMRGLPVDARGLH
jgi:hypothetical protein